MNDKSPLQTAKPKPPEGAWFPVLGLTVVVAAFQLLLASTLGVSDSMASPECVAILAYACVLGYANQRLYGTAALLAAPWLLFVLGTALYTAEHMTAASDFVKVGIMAIPLLLAGNGVRESALGGAFFTALAVVSIGAFIALFVLYPNDTTQLLVNILTRMLLPLPIGLACGYVLRRNVAKPDPLLQSPPIENLIPAQYSLMSIIATMTAVAVAVGMVVLAKPSLRLLGEWAGAVVLGDALGMFIAVAALMRTHREYTMEELRTFKDPEPPLMLCPTCGRESRTRTIFCPNCKTTYPPGSRVKDDEAA